MTLTWLEINNSAIIDNLKSFRYLIGAEKKLMTVVKSNAYGHGIYEIAKIIELGKIADKLCVASGQEAIFLLKRGIKTPVLILSYWSLDEAREILKLNCKTAFSVYSVEQAKFLNKISRKKTKIHLKIDTGASRIGVSEEEAFNLVKKMLALPRLEIEGIFTQYADSEKNNEFTRQQTKTLQEIKKKLSNISLSTYYHAACSAAAITNKNNLFDGMRLGISLYGLWPSNHVKKTSEKKDFKIHLKPALFWKTRVIQVKKIKKNTSVGYGRTYKTKTTEKIAVPPVGYYDGLDRSLSNKGSVFIKGVRCPIRGRVCMNLTMVDVSLVKNIKIGDEVELLGEHITAEEIAKICKTINYEIISRINPLLPRFYKIKANKLAGQLKFRSSV